jgi:hypothetical protein
LDTLWTLFWVPLNIPRLVPKLIAPSKHGPNRNLVAARTTDAVYQELTRNTQLFDVSSSFAMETIKFTTALPLDHMRDQLGTRQHTSAHAGLSIDLL